MSVVTKVHEFFARSFRWLLMVSPLALAIIPTTVFSAPQASLTVSCGVAKTCSATNTEWSLTKTLAAQDAGSASFTVTAEKVSVSHAMITLSGSLTVLNSGTAKAYVGGIVVNLQRKNGKNWYTASSDIADATKGDAATTAHICAGASSEGKNSFTETTASGALEFTDANSNTLFSISPDFVIERGATKVLTYTAKFDNTILRIPAGESVRAEAIVSFANVATRGGSGAACANVDVDGNGSIEAVEAYVRSVPCRSTLLVPTLEASNATVLLTDTADHLKTDGTVTVTDFATLLGQGEGTAQLDNSGSFSVTVYVDPGASGGTLTNSATLVAAPTPACNTPVSLSDEATAQFGVDPLVPSIQDEDFCSYTQGGWGGTPNGNNPASLLANNFATMYATGVEVGITGAAGFSMQFTAATAVGHYLPAGGTAAALTADLLIDPTSSSSGVFGGQVLALQLNVDFSNSGITPVGFGSLKVDGGKTVSEILADANAALGGATGYNIADLNPLVTNLNEAVDNCTVSSWASEHLTR